MKKTVVVVIASILVFVGVGVVSSIFLSNSSDSPFSRFLGIVGEKTVTKTDYIPYGELLVPDDSLEYGKTKNIQSGAKGEKTVKFNVIYNGNGEISRTELEEQITKQPTSQTIAVGTKIVWTCYDTTSYNENPYDDNKCVSNTGTTVYVPDSKSRLLDPSYTPSEAGDPYYNNF